jgi:hypothetical protein
MYEFYVELPLLTGVQFLRESGVRNWLTLTDPIESDPIQLTPDYGNESIYRNVAYIVACRAITRRRPRGGRLYQDRFSATARKHVPDATDTNTTIKDLFSMRSVPICYKQGTRSVVSSVR